MRTYAIRRLLLFIPTLFILSMLVFFMVRALPGDIVDLIVAENQFAAVSNEEKDRLRVIMGLDVPAHIAYVRWMRGILLEGTLGQSLQRGNRPVEGKILARVPVSLELGGVALLIGLVIALPVGIYSAVRQDTLGDYAGRSVAIFGLATPNFWLALMVLIFPGIWWGWTPPLRLFDFSEDPVAHIGMFLIPGLILGTGLSAATMRMTRTMMLEVLAAGLRAHGVGEGPTRAGGRGSPRPEERAHPGDHPHRAAAADPGRRLGHHRDAVQPARPGVAARRVAGEA